MDHFSVPSLLNQHLVVLFSAGLHIANAFSKYMIISLVYNLKDYRTKLEEQVTRIS